MRKWVFCGILSALLAVPAFAAKGPEIALVNNKLSVDAESIPLSRLIRLLDQATGMKSKVPPDLANRNISVKFSGLNLSDGVRKIFQGQPFDYLVVEGQGIIITGASQMITGTETVPVYTPQPGEPPPQPFVQDFQQPFPQPGVAGQPPIPGQPVAGQPQQTQTTTLQSPFGPMTVQRPVQQNGALSSPGQNNALFPNTNQNPFPNNTAQPGAPTAQPANPFSSPSPFIPAQPQSNGMGGATNLFPGNPPH